jgi:RimJ/RimL family protein N-acetyltransferase
MTTPVLKTERLTLRPLSMADASRIARFTADPEVAAMISDAALPTLKISAEGRILIHQGRAGLGLEHLFAIDLPNEGLIGEAAAARDGKNGVEIGYWLGKPFWGQGYGEEAAKAVTGFAQSLRPHKVRAVCAVDNRASRRVLEKAGFAPTGERLQRYSLARRESVACLAFELR